MPEPKTPSPSYTGALGGSRPRLGDQEEETNGGETNGGDPLNGTEFDVGHAIRFIQLLIKRFRSKPDQHRQLMLLLSHSSEHANGQTNGQSNGDQLQGGISQRMSSGPASAYNDPFNRLANGGNDARSGKRFGRRLTGDRRLAANAAASVGDFQSHWGKETAHIQTW
jgi:hypothetical protein